MIRYYILFVVSGFCSILYELVWLRIAMAQFSVTTAYVSVVLSTFMLGLGLGSWIAGRYAGAHAPSASTALRLYAATELLIGISALAVPLELRWGRSILHSLAQDSLLSPGAYYAVSGIWTALSLAPWCACMGATFPLAIAAIRRSHPRESARSFSYLYLANLSGGILGSFFPLLLIEAFGFTGASKAALSLNLALAASAFALSRRAWPAAAKEAPRRDAAPAPASESRTIPALLLATGLTTMGSEVIWVRLLTPYLGTVVYAFAGILGSYLAATFLGSRLYRMSKAYERLPKGAWLAILGLTALLPLIACDPRREFPALLRLAIAVVPFSAAAGFLTPLLLDRFSRGDPGRAGRGYAINIVGCVAGPLVSGFVLLPLFGEPVSLLLLAAPWILLGWFARDPVSGRRRPAVNWTSAAAAATALILVLFTRSYEWKFKPRVVRRDHTATVVAYGATREDKRLLVNGVGITSLTPITKMMAHLPLAFLPRAPQAGLVICFGMGTTHRSVLSWGIRSTAVELAPSVPALFSYFHSDGALLLASPLSRVVIDDGRFYLERTRETYDVIVVDPPPPVEAAASSLLYSREFYAAAKARLRPGGIVQQWVPGADAVAQAAIARTLRESFPFVRVFQSVENWGYHFLATESPFPAASAAELAARLPARAAADLVEWGPASTAERQFAQVLSREVPPEDLIRRNPGVPAVADDRPINEYYLMRTLFR
jgi:spermidine synthase